MGAQYTYRPRQGSSRARRGFFAVTALIILIVAIDVLSGGIVRSGAQTLTGRVSQLGAAATVSIGGSGYFSSRAKLTAEIDSLREQLTLYRERAALYGALVRENEELRLLAHLAERSGGITAPVISSFRASPYGTFHIGAGESDGVRAGDLVLTASGFALGRVAEVNAHQSTIITLLASGERVDALIGEVPVVLEGRGGGNAIANAPRAARVVVGDVAVSTQYANRPVGVVGRIESEAASAEQTLYLNLPSNLASMRYVYVVATSF